MTKKYYADIDLYFDERKHSIVADETVKRREMTELLEDFGKKRKLTMNAKSKKFFDETGREVGSFEIGVKVY